MKKIFISIFALLLITGCGTKKEEMKASDRVEEFLLKYVELDSDVLKDLDTVIDTENILTESQKDEYREIMKDHYKDLKYEIIDEQVNGDSATVTVKIEVTDLSKVLSESETYLKENEKEFLDEENNYSQELFNNYRLEKLKEAKDKVEYTIDLTLSKVDKRWYLDDIDSVTESKINGTYEY